MKVGFDCFGSVVMFLSCKHKWMTNKMKQNKEKTPRCQSSKQTVNDKALSSGVYQPGDVLKGALFQGRLWSWLVCVQVFTKLKKYSKVPDFKAEAVGKVSLACRSLCMWVLAMEHYNEVYKVWQEFFVCLFFFS